MSHLFEPLAVRGVTLRNRIGVSPMCQYSLRSRGSPTDWHLVHLGRRAVGGAALVIAEATAVEPRGRISPQDLGHLGRQSTSSRWRASRRFIAAQGAVPGIQLAHAGRKASVHRPWEGGAAAAAEPRRLAHRRRPRDRRSPTAGRCREALTRDEHRRGRAALRGAARRALRRRLRVVELHGAHGYLLPPVPLAAVQPRATTSTAARSRTGAASPLEVVEAVRARLAGGAAALRARSRAPTGPRAAGPSRTRSRSRAARSGGVDLIDCARAATSPAHGSRSAPGYQVPFAERVRREAGIPTARSA